MPSHTKRGTPEPYFRPPFTPEEFASGAAERNLSDEQRALFAEPIATFGAVDFYILLTAAFATNSAVRSQVRRPLFPPPQLPRPHYLRDLVEAGGYAQIARESLLQAPRYSDPELDRFSFATTLLSVIQNPDAIPAAECHGVQRKRVGLTIHPPTLANPTHAPALNKVLRTFEAHTWTRHVGAGSSRDPRYEPAMQEQERTLKALFPGSSIKRMELESPIERIVRELFSDRTFDRDTFSQIRDGDFIGESTPGVSHEPVVRRIVEARSAYRRLHEEPGVVAFDADARILELLLRPLDDPIRKAVTDPREKSILYLRHNVARDERRVALEEPTDALTIPLDDVTDNDLPTVFPRADPWSARLIVLQNDLDRHVLECSMRMVDRGEQPSLRTVADELGVSKERVGSSLKRIRKSFGVE